MAPKRAGAFAALIAIAFLFGYLAYRFVFAFDLNVMMTTLPAMLLVPVIAYLAVWSFAAMRRAWKERDEAAGTDKEAAETETEAPAADKEVTAAETETTADPDAEPLETDSQSASAAADQA